MKSNLLFNFVLFVWVGGLIATTTSCSDSEPSGVNYHAELTTLIPGSTGHCTAVLSGTMLSVTIDYSGFVATGSGVYNENNGKQLAYDLGFSGSPIKKTVTLTTNEVDDLNLNKLFIQVQGTFSGTADIIFLKGTLTK